jgi:hypothetical protein
VFDKKWDLISSDISKTIEKSGKIHKVSVEVPAGLNPYYDTEITARLNYHPFFQ